MTKLELCDGKYTVVDELFTGGGFYALRHGEKWRSLAGDKLVYSMFCEIEELRKEKEQLRASIEISKRIVKSLTHENAILRGEKPITVHLNGGDDFEHEEGEPPSDMSESGVSISDFKTVWIEGGDSE